MHVQDFPGPHGPIDVHIAPGERVWIRGPNGSGKTSLLRCLAGLPAPMGTASRKGAGLCFQDGRDNLIGLTVDGEFRLRNLAEVGDARETTKLSTGETKNLALQLSKAQSWCLDEPMDGLDEARQSNWKETMATYHGPIAFTDHTGLLSDVATRIIDLGPSTFTSITLEGQADDWTVGEHRFSSSLAVIRGPIGSGKTTLLRDAARASECAYLPPNAGDILFQPTKSPWLDPPPRHPLHWSGGELQRGALHRVLSQDKPLYILDEPERFMDGTGRALLQETLQALLDDGKRLLIATHEDMGDPCWL